MLLLFAVVVIIIVAVIVIIISVSAKSIFDRNKKFFRKFYSCFSFYAREKNFKNFFSAN